MVPTGRLALVALGISLVIAAVPGTPPGGYFLTIGLVNLALLLVGLSDAIRAGKVTTVQLSREHPSVVSLETEAELTWVLHNPSQRSLRVAFCDDLLPSFAAPFRSAAVTVKSGATARISTTIRPTRRGRFVLEGATVRLRGPLGLMARQGRVSVPSVLHVHPAFRSAKEAELRIRKARVLEVGLRSVKGLGTGTEFEQLRDYSPDDEFRRIDWAASARTGRPIVKTYRPERNQSVVVLLDNGRVMASMVEGVPRLEHAMDAAMALTFVASHLGDKVGLVTFDQEVRSVLAPARHHHQTAMAAEAMYALHTVYAESDYREAFRQTLSRFRRRALLVVLTDLSEEAMNESFIPAMPLVLRRHLVVVAAVQDPAVQSWAKSAGDEAETAYRSSAAIAELARRERLARRLRGMGVHVVDAPAGKLGAELSDAYLQLKSAGRL
jgi:uncharacterized protein (DUF58 family)